MKIENRVKNKIDFSIVIKKGITLKNKFYIGHIIENNSLGHARVGVSASSKLGNAVVRNKTRRQFRAISDNVIVYNNYHFDLVVIIKEPFLNSDYQERKYMLESLLENYL